MDSNVHSILWGSETNSRSEWLQELILYADLNLENLGRKPTFVGRQTSTVIDLSLIHI